MLSVNDAIKIAKQNNKNFVIDSYMESDTSYIFPITDPNGPNESDYFYEVNKNTGEHGTFDYWGSVFEDTGFEKVMKSLKKIG